MVNIVNKEKVISHRTIVASYTYHVYLQVYMQCRTWNWIYALEIYSWDTPSCTQHSQFYGYFFNSFISTNVCTNLSTWNKLIKRNGISCLQILPITAVSSRALYRLLDRKAFPAKKSLHSCSNKFWQIAVRITQ